MPTSTYTPNRYTIESMLARVTLMRDCARDPAGRLQRATQRTCRRRFTSRPVDTITTMEQDAAIQAEGARLAILSEPEQRHQAAVRVSEGDPSPVIAT